MSQPWDPKANSILHRAIEIGSPDRRASYLEEACADNQELRRRVERLLIAHEEAGSFLQRGLAISESATDPTERLAEGVGTQIGPYKLLQEIGEGGFGVVYMAEQTQPVHRMVALKIIKPGMDTREVIARLEVERQALAMMDHPNIAKVLDGGTTDSGRPYFVMELVKGVPLTEFCDQRKLSTRERLGLFGDVCRAVQHAHQKGIIHRDLKPSNVMITLHDGMPVPKVIDFGVSKAISQKLTEKTMFTAYGQMIGTPQYMSPEQAEMSGLDIDTRSDIYSLGVLLYELLTGTTPLDAKRLKGQMFSELQKLIREEEAPRPSTRLSTLGNATAAVAAKRGTDARKLGALLRGELDWIVMKSLEKDRSRRYETANSLASDVQRYLNDEPVVACPPSMAYRLRKMVRRHRTALATSAVVATALVVGTVVSTSQAIRATSAEREARRNAAIAQDNATKASRLLTRALASESDLQASQLVLQERLYASDMRLASQAYADGDIKHMNELLEKHRPAADRGKGHSLEWYHLWLAGHCHEDWVRNPLTGAFRSMAVSPDRQTLAVVGFPGRVFVYDIATSSLLCRPIKVGWERDIPCFSPDGDFLIVGGYEVVPQTTRVFNTDTWQPVKTLDSGVVRTVVFCQEKPLMAVGGPDAITLWSTSQWKRRSKLDTRGIVKDLAFAPDGTKIVASLEGSGLQIWDLQEKMERPLSGYGGAMAASHDGKLLAIEDPNDGTIDVWNSNDFFRSFAENTRIEPIQTFSVTAPVISLALSADGSRLVASLETGKNTVVVWDVTSNDGQPLARIRGHSRLVFGVAFGQDANTVWSSGEDGYLRAWNLDRCLPYDTWPRVGSTPQPGQTRVNTDSPIGYLDKNTIVFLDDQGKIQQWDVERGAHQAPLDVDHQYACIALSDNAQYVGGVTHDRTLRVWDLTTPRPTSSSVPLGQRDADRLAISRDGSKVALLAIGPTSAQLDMVDAHTGKWLTQDFIDNSSPRGWPTFSPDGHHLVARRWDSSGFHTEVWDVSDGAAKSGDVPFQLNFAIQGGPDNCAAFSPDGTMLALGSYGHDIRLHDALTGELLRTLKGHTGEVCGLAFTQSGQRLVSIALDGTLRFWKVGADGQWRLVSTLHTDFSPESNKWRLHQPTANRTVGSDWRVGAVGVAPDGSSVATVNNDGVLRVWRTATVEEVNRNDDQQRVQTLEKLMRGGRVTDIVLRAEKEESKRLTATLHEAYRGAPDRIFQRQLLAEHFARQLMQQGRWKEVAVCHDELVKLAPNDHVAWVQAATLAAYNGNLDRYHQLCGDMLKQFRETNDPRVAERIAKACLISTPRQSRLPAIREMADRPLELGSYDWHMLFVYVTKALAEFRFGNDRAAIDWAEKCLAGIPDVPQWLDDVSRDVPFLRHALVVLAMAHARQREAELANEKLAAFRDFLDEHSPLRTRRRIGSWNNQFMRSWQEWLICEVLLREAAQEIPVL